MSPSDNQLPSLPKGMVINKKLIVLVSCAAVVFLGLFISMLQFSAPKITARDINTPLIDNQSAMEMIHRLQRNKARQPVLHEENETLINQESVFTEQPNPLLLTKFDNGSAISVFRQVSQPAFDKGHSPVPQTALELPRTEPQMPNDYKQQNQQREKQDFLSHQVSSNASMLAGFEPLTALCAIKAGSVIPAMLQTTINSDLPGTIIGKVRQSVFDSVSGQHLLIPQGSTLLGQYDADVAYGQNRILIAWQRLIFPSGESYQLEGQPGVDGLGAAGLKDKVNNHLARIFSSSLLFSILSAAGNLPRHHGEAEPDALLSTLGDPIAQKMTQTGMSMLNKNLNIQPTLIARVGMRFNVLLRQDLVFPGASCA